jgi:hypothetical protein
MASYTGTSQFFESQNRLIPSRTARCYYLSRPMLVEGVLPLITGRRG